MITALTFNKRENFLLACKKGQAFEGKCKTPRIGLSFFDFYIIARFFGTPGVLFSPGLQFSTSGASTVPSSCSRT